MASLITPFLDGIREDLGIPAKLLRLLDTHDVHFSLNPASASVHVHSSVVPWNEWGNLTALSCGRPGVLRGWSRHGAYYDSIDLCPEYFASFGQTEVAEEWTCDILDVQGLSASKSDLREFATLDAFAEQRAPDLIDPISHEKLRKNLAHHEIRICRADSNSADYLARYRWDGRLFLMNDGGSHHFAAARYIASRLGEPVPLRGKLLSHGLNQHAISLLAQDFEVLALADDPATSNALHHIFESFRATYFTFPLPSIYHQGRAYLFPKSEPRSTCVADVLRRAGCTDVCEHLLDLCQQRPTMTP